LLFLSLPKGIGAFLFAVIGLAVGIAGSALIIGLPLLAFVLIVCRRMLESEHGQTAAWASGRKPSDAQTADRGGPAHGGRGLKSLLAVLADGRSWRGVVYCMLQLPAGAVFFALALILPLTALAVMLAPAAWFIVEREFGYALFAEGWLFEFAGRTFGLTPYQQSWFVGGLGLLLVLLVPAAVRMLGRFYAAWIEGIAGTEPAADADQVPAPASSPGLPETEPIRDAGDAGNASSPLQLELERLETRLAADTLRS
jgi:hypothetical protein